MIFCMGFVFTHSNCFASDKLHALTLKAHYLFHIAKFTHWKTLSETEEGVLVLCVANKVLFQDAFNAIEGKKIAEREFLVKDVQVSSDISMCNMLFVDAESERFWQGQDNRMSDILTVGETDRFLKNGGIVKFYMRHRKLRFAIHLDHLQAANFSIEGRLLRLATIVRNGI